MVRKKVLIISYYWPPSGGSGVQRWVKFCKYLPEFGIEPIILTVQNGTYPIIDPSLGSDVRSETKIFYAKSLEPYSLFAKLSGRSKEEISTPSTAFSTKGSLLKKIGVWIRSNLFVPDARVGWIPFAFSKAKNIITDHHIDTVITTGPPNSTHIIGTKLKKWSPELRWIMDMRDPWTEIFYNETLPRSSIAKALDTNFENKALRIADKVIVASPGAVQLQNGIHPREYEVLTNGFDHKDFELLENSGKSSKNAEVIIKYIGSMTEKAIPVNFFKALQESDEKIKSFFKIHFIGSYNEKLATCIENFKLSKLVTFTDYLPHLEAKKEMLTADLLLLVIPDTSHNLQILPGKMFDYIAAQSPIICIAPPESDASLLIEEHEVGYSFNYDDIKGFKKLFELFYSEGITNNKTDYTSLKNHPYSRFTLTKKLVKIINSI